VLTDPTGETAVPAGGNGSLQAAGIASLAPPSSQYGGSPRDTNFKDDLRWEAWMADSHGLPAQRVASGVLHMTLITYGWTVILRGNNEQKTGVRYTSWFFGAAFNNQNMYLPDNRAYKPGHIQELKHEIDPIRGRGTHGVHIYLSMWFPPPYGKPHGVLLGMSKALTCDSSTPQKCFVSH
jgi:hypothetical protein